MRLRQKIKVCFCDENYTQKTCIRSGQHRLNLFRFPISKWKMFTDRHSCQRLNSHHFLAISFYIFISFFSCVLSFVLEKVNFVLSSAIRTLDLFVVVLSSCLNVCHIFKPSKNGREWEKKRCQPTRQTTICLKSVFRKKVDDRNAIANANRSFPTLSFRFHSFVRPTTFSHSKFFRQSHKFHRNWVDIDTGKIRTEKKSKKEKKNVNKNGRHEVDDETRVYFTLAESENSKRQTDVFRCSKFHFTTAKRNRNEKRRKKNSTNKLFVSLNTQQLDFFFSSPLRLHSISFNIQTLEPNTFFGLTFISKFCFFRISFWPLVDDQTTQWKNLN